MRSLIRICWTFKRPGFLPAKLWGRVLTEHGAGERTGRACQEIPSEEQLLLRFFSLPTQNILLGFVCLLSWSKGREIKVMEKRRPDPAKPNSAYRREKYLSNVFPEGLRVQAKQWINCSTGEVLSLDLVITSQARWPSRVAQLAENPPAMRETPVQRSSGEGNGYPLQYSGLQNSMDCVVHGVAKSQTWLSNSHFTS